MFNPSPALEVRDLSVEIGGTRLLSGINWSVFPGSISAVAGPNGAGKSTLLRAVLGLNESTGDIRTSPSEHEGSGEAPPAQRLAWVPQSSSIIAALSVSDVVMQGRFANRGPWRRPTLHDRDVAARAMKDADITHLVGRTFTTLSGGEQRRVLIARALATEAPVLLLDEPTAGLDLRHVFELFELLRRLADEGRSVVVVVHDLHLVLRYADTVLVLCCGEKVADGAPREVLNDELLASIYGIRRSNRSIPAFELAVGTSENSSATAIDTEDG